MVTLVKVFQQLLVDSIQMKYFGNPIGPAVEEVGMKKVVPELNIGVLSLTNIKRSPESMNGLTKECKSSLRKLFLHYGRKRLKNNIVMMKRP